MKVLYVYAHPNPNSFNALLKQHAVNMLSELNQEITVSDLYAEKFNAVASFDDFNLAPSSDAQYFLLQSEAIKHNKVADDIMDEIEKVKSADHIIFQFPLWWFSVPAILKGWFDRVLMKGFAYDSGKVFNDGLLKNKSASLVVTTQSPESSYQINGVHGATIESFLLPIHHTLRFVGIETLKPFVVFNAFDLDDERTNKIIKHYLDSLKSLIK